MSASVQQAGKALQYLDGIFTEVPALAAMVEGKTADSIALTNRVDIQCAAASFRTIRGGTAIAILADEVAFWRSENTANPDTEIVAAARPMLATTGGLLACISSPYSRRGELWNAYRRDFGAQGDPLILVAKAASRAMNRTLPEKVPTRAYERDPAAALAEYGAGFRTDVESFVSRDAIDGATVPGRLELPPVADEIGYAAFVDPSGGAQDSMTLAIAHSEGDTAILDAVREVKPPFSPDAVVGEFAALLADYRLNEITGDRWGGEFVREQFERRGVNYVVSERSKSEIYRELLPLLNSRRVELLDHPRMAAQLGGLERRTALGGRDSIDHAPGAHDDLINAAAGALVNALGVGSGTSTPASICALMVDRAGWRPRASQTARRTTRGCGQDPSSTGRLDARPRQAHNAHMFSGTAEGAGAFYTDWPTSFWITALSGNVFFDAALETQRIRPAGAKPSRPIIAATHETIGVQMNSIAPPAVIASSSASRGHRRRVAVLQANVARAVRVAQEAGPAWRVEIDGSVVRLIQGESPPSVDPALRGLRVVP
jgi:hypothetical protein